MGGNIEALCTRGTAVLAKAVMALCWYLRLWYLSRAERQSRLKKRLGWEVIFPRAIKAARWGEKVGTDLGGVPRQGLSQEGSRLALGQQGGVGGI